MFARLKHRKQKEKPAKDTMQDRARGTSVNYDPMMITRFKGHHISLLKTVDAVKQATQAGEYLRIERSLRTLQRVLGQHLQEEDRKLYGYLATHLEKDEKHGQHIRDMKREMADITRKTTSFMRRYDESGVNSSNFEAFSRELRQLESLLRDRINREEHSLFTLYQAPEQYKKAS